MGAVKDLVDVFPVRLSLEEGVSGRVLIKGPFGHCAEPTSNGRLYKKPIMEREFKRLKESMESRRMFGELDHPADGKTSLKRVSHIITGLSIDENGEVVGELEPLPTPMGDILKALAKAGCELGVSSRGRGSVVTRDDGVDEVQEDFVLKTYDVVDNPASKNAFPSVVESEQVDSFLESIDEEHREDVRHAFTQAASKIAVESAVEYVLSRDLEESASAADYLKAAKRGRSAAAKEFKKTLAENGEESLVEAIQSEMNKHPDVYECACQEEPGVEDSPDADEAQDTDDAEVSEEVRPGQYFVLVDVSKPGGKMVSELIRGSKAADRQAEKARKGGKNIQVIDAKWYGPAAEILKATGMSESEAPDETDFAVPGEAELAEKFEAALPAMREELEVKIRAEMLADPSVAAAKTMVEQIAGMIRPLFPLGVQDDKTNRENVALKDALKTRDFDLAVAKMEAEKTGKVADAKMMEAHLLTRIAGHPKAEAIQKMIGPVSRVESIDSLDDRIDAAFDAMGTPESHVPDVEEAVESEREKWEALLSEKSAEAEGLKRELAKKSVALERAVTLGEEIEESREALESLSESLKVKAYAAERSMLRPDAAHVFALCEGASSEEDVDRIISANAQRPELRESMEVAAEKARRASERKTVREEEVRRQPRNSGMFLGEGLTVDLAEAASLAGVSSNNRR